MELRCSALPRLSTCQMSAVKPKVLVNTESEASSLGTAIHSVAAFFIHNNYWPDLGSVAADYGVGEDELVRLYYALRDAMEEILRWGEVVYAENKFRYEFDGNVLTGSPDLVLKNADTGQIIIVDWKSGYIQTNYAEQMYGYSVLVERELESECDKVKTCVVWLREKEIDVREVDPDPDRLFHLVKKIKNASEYVVTGHCTFCPRADECPARAEELKGMANTLIETKGEISLTNMVAMYDKAKLVENALKTYRKRLNEMLESGPISHDGRIFELKKVSKKKIKTPQTYSLLVDEINQASLIKCMDFNKKKLETLFGELAPEKQKGKYIRERMSRLEEAGCFSEITYTKINVKKGEKPND